MKPLPFLLNLYSFKKKWIYNQLNSSLKWEICIEVRANIYREKTSDIVRFYKALNLCQVVELVILQFHQSYSYPGVKFKSRTRFVIVCAAKTDYCPSGATQQQGQCLNSKEIV